MTATLPRVSPLAMLAVFALTLDISPAGLASHPLLQPWGGRYLFVSSDGVADAPGTRERPLSLEAALSAASPARPGDTLWLRGGVYRGTFTSVLRGTAADPILVRQYPGERAVIDSAPSREPALTVLGSWTTYWGFEITSSDPQRETREPGSWPADGRRGPGVFARGRSNQFVNLVVHDLSDGLGLWAEAQGSGAYGNIIFYNGWQGRDRSHGHGIYTQNQTGVREIAENVIFNQFSHGIHAYGSSQAYLDDIVLRGNVVFNNGLLGVSGPERDILVGGGRPAHRMVLEENATFGPGHSNLGYSAGCVQATVRNNYFAGVVPLKLVQCVPLMSGNTFVGAGGIRESDGANVYFDQPPPETVAIVRPNRYEPGRAHVIVYNWTQRPSIDINPGPLLPDGASFEVHDVQNLLAPPVAAGVYRTGTAIRIPLTAQQVAAPAGVVPVAPRHTLPTFGVFLLRPVVPPPAD